LTVNEFTREVFNRRELIVFDPDTWRPYCHVQDFAEIVELVLSAPKDRVHGEIFNAGSEDNNFTKRQVITTIARFADISRVVFKDKGTDPRNYKVNFSKIREVLNFSPSYSLEEGVVEILSFLQTKEIDLSAQNRNLFGNYYLEWP
jgi:nucleoside-diphosphate-sugar epimerase